LQLGNELQQGPSRSTWLVDQMTVCGCMVYIY